MSEEFQDPLYLTAEFWLFAETLLRTSNPVAPCRQLLNPKKSRQLPQSHITVPSR
jgi:hypothetical protein